MAQKQDVQIEGSSYLLSLSKMAGRKIADIHGYVSDPFDVGATFQLCHIILDDGTSLDVQGEHDCAFLCSENNHQIDADGLEQYMDE